MEVATRETAHLIDRLVSDILGPLRKEGIDIDAASRRSLRSACLLSSRSVVCKICSRLCIAPHNREEITQAADCETSSRKLQGNRKTCPIMETEAATLSSAFPALQLCPQGSRWHLRNGPASGRSIGRPAAAQAFCTVGTKQEGSQASKMPTVRMAAYTCTCPAASAFDYAKS